MDCLFISRQDYTLPLESYGLVEPTSWKDEYKRIYRLFWETLRE
jgi:hypothetical protein